MKRIAALVLLAFLVSAQATQNYLTVSNIVLSPSASIYAGEDFTLSFDLYNTWRYTSEDISVQLQGGYPFLSISPSQTQQIGFIGSSGQLGQYPMVYHLHVDEKALAGTYTLNAVVSYRTQQETLTAGFGQATTLVGRTETTPITISVRGKPNITASYSAAAIQPASASTITVTFTNEGNDDALSLSAVPGDTQDFKLQGTSSFFIGELKAKASAPLSIPFRVESSAQEGEHSLPISISYADKYGNKYLQTLSVPVLVRFEEPQLNVLIASSQPTKIRAGDTASLTIRVWNNGDGLAKGVSLSNSADSPLKVLWPSNSIFIGDIAANSFATAVVQLDVDDDARPGDWSMLSKAEFANANSRNKYVENYTLPVQLENAARFTVSDSVNDLFPDDKWKPVTFQVENTGSKLAEEIRVTLDTQYPLTPSGKEQFLLSLAPGQKANVTFHLDVDSSAVPQIYPLDLYFQWNEGGEAIYASTKTYFVQVQPSPPSLWLPIIGVFIAVVIIVFAARKLLKKKKKQAPLTQRS